MPRGCLLLHFVKRHPFLSGDRGASPFSRGASYSGHIDHGATTRPTSSERAGISYRAGMSADSSGWNVHPLDDGWRECSAAIFAPTGGVIEMMATGLVGCEVQFVVDGQATNAYVLPARHDAYMSRPVFRGRHQIAVRWRGAVAEPGQVEARFLYLSRTIADLEKDRPEVAAVMKKNNHQDFTVCDIVILSQPAGALCQVYGIFTVDKNALAGGGPNAPVLKQDFLVNDRSVQPQEITHYTGFPAPGPHRSIEEFC